MDCRGPSRVHRRNHGPRHGSQHEASSGGSGAAYGSEDPDHPSCLSFCLQRDVLQIRTPATPGSGVGDNLSDSITATRWTEAHFQTLELSATAQYRTDRARMEWTSRVRTPGVPRRAQAPIRRHAMHRAASVGVAQMPGWQAFATRRSEAPRTVCRGRMVGRWPPPAASPTLRSG